MDLVHSNLFLSPYPSHCEMRRNSDLIGVKGRLVRLGFRFVMLMLVVGRNVVMRVPRLLYTLFEQGLEIFVSLSNFLCWIEELSLMDLTLWCFGFGFGLCWFRC